MRLHTVIVSYGRQGLTKLTLESYLDTVSIPYDVCIVDNNSDDETRKWLRSLKPPIKVHYLGKNMYPGFATNYGWQFASSKVTLLQRSDNDTEYLPNWCDEMVEVFESDPLVGQYGPIAEGDDQWSWMPCWPCGGNSIIHRKLYDEGLRYTEKPWPELEIIEEHQLSLDVWAMGYKRVFGTRPGIKYLTDGDFEYIKQSHKDRGIWL